ncbi:MAG: hypothetical protein HXY40_07375 [Chloroflexi bacterium]|nr:hypothetical protein [Chloroflexota bacterium]
MNATWWLIAVPLAFSPLAYLAGHVQRCAAQIVTLAGLALVGLFLAAAAQEVAVLGSAEYAFGAIALRVDGVSLLLAGIIVALAALTTLFSGALVQNEAGEEKYYALTLALVGTILALVCARDLFNLWVWFEGMAIASCLLVVFARERDTALEAAVKYLLQSAVGSALALLGMALVLAQVGTLSLDMIRQNASSSPTLWAAGALFVVGFGVKAALVPLHTWLPDAYTQSPSPVAALLAGVVTEVGLIALLRALAALSGVSNIWGGLLLAFAALNMLSGTLLALRQRDVKRMLAYSSISHIGYMLLGLGIGLSSGALAGTQAGLFHLFNHALMKGLAFLALGALFYGLRAADGDALTLGDVKGAAQRYPLTTLTLLVALLGLGGIPPLAGFMSKWQIFAAGVATGDGLILALLVLALLNVMLSMLYYLRLATALYDAQPGERAAAGRAIPLALRVPLWILALAVLVIGVFPDMARGLTQAAALALW